MGFLNPAWFENFSTEDSRYNAYVKFLIGYFLAIIAASFISEVVSETLGTLFLIALDIFVLYAAVILWHKSGMFKLLFKLVTGLFLSLVIGSFIIALTGGVGIIFMMLAAIFINRRRLNFVKKYQRYIWIPVTVLVLSVVIAVITFLLFTPYVSTRNDFFIALLLANSTIGLTSQIIGIIATVMFAKREQKRGMPFLSFFKLTFTVPLTFLFYITAVFTMAIHFFDFGDGTDATDGAGLMTDPMSDPTLLAPEGFHGEGLTATVDNNSTFENYSSSSPNFVDINNQNVSNNSDDTQFSQNENFTTHQQVDSQNNPAMQEAQRLADNVHNRSEQNSGNNFRITDSQGVRTAVEVQNGQILDERGIHVGRVTTNPLGDTEIQNMSGRPIVRSDGENIFDENQMPIDENIRIENGIIYDRDTGRIIGHIERSNH